MYASIFSRCIDRTLTSFSCKLEYIFWRCVDRTLTSCSCLVRFQAGAIICDNILKVCWSYLFLWTENTLFSCVDIVFLSCKMPTRCNYILKVCWLYFDGMGWEGRCCHLKCSTWWAEHLVSYDSTCCITHIILVWKIGVSKSFSYHGKLTIWYHLGASKSIP